MLKNGAPNPSEFSHGMEVLLLALTEAVISSSVPYPDNVIGLSGNETRIN